MNEESVSQKLAVASAKLLRGWKAVALGTLVPTLVLAPLLFLVPNSYKATSLLMLSQDQKSGMLSKLSSMGGGELAAMAGLGGNNADGDALELLGSSQSLALDAIERFGFARQWSGEGKPLKREMLIKAWYGKFQFVITPKGGVEVSFEDTSAALTAKVVDYAVHWLDSAFTSTRMRQAEISLDFVTRQVEERRRTMERMEDSLLRFQTRNRVYLPNEQLGLSTRTLLESEERLQQLDLELAQVRATQGRNSSAALGLEEMRRNMVRKRDDLRSGDVGEKVGVLLQPGKNISAVYNFQRMARNLERQAAVYKQLVQQQELLTIEARKNTPVLTLVDKALVPEKKTSPPRGMILEAFFMVCFFLSSAFVLGREHVADFWKHLRGGLGKVA